MTLEQGHEENIHQNLLSL